MPLSSCLAWNQGKRKIKSRKQRPLTSLECSHAIYDEHELHNALVRSGEAKAERRMHCLELAKEAEASPNRGKDPACYCRLRGGKLPQDYVTYVRYWSVKQRGEGRKQEERVGVRAVQVLWRNEHDAAPEECLWHKGSPYERQEALLRAQGKWIIYIKNSIPRHLMDKQIS